MFCSYLSGSYRLPFQFYTRAKTGTANLRAETRADKASIELLPSRDQEDKEYVQHVVRREAPLVAQFVRDGARVFIAGNAKQMPDQVTQEVAAAIGLRGEEAEKFVEDMTRHKRLQMDTWS